MLRYQITVGLTEADDKRLRALKKRGIKIVDVFRRGLDAMAAQEAARVAAEAVKD